MIIVIQKNFLFKIVYYYINLLYKDYNLNFYFLFKNILFNKLFSQNLNFYFYFNSNFDSV